VVFDVADRCLPGQTCSQSNPQAWPDTPWDQYCAAAPCTDALAPTFWTQKRLDRVRAQVLRDGSYSTVESWQLRHLYLDAGAADGEGVPMWLAGVTRTGHVTRAGGSAVSDPEITFDTQAPLANRVDGPSDGKTKINRFRVQVIHTESGATVGAVYSQPECTRSSLPTPHTNTGRCFPQWYGLGAGEPTLDWFHKYVVTTLVVGDTTGASPAMETHYQYLDSPAWRYADSELVPEDKRTWSTWRGYSKVRVVKGHEQETRSATEYLYLRGMHGDRAGPSGGTRTVEITDSQGVSITDHEAHAGFLREETLLDGPGGDWVSGTISSPWRHGPTATSGPLKSYLTDTATTRTRTRLEGGAVRWTRRDADFDTTYGLPTQVDDRGDEATSTDNLCTRFTYARNTSIWMVDKVNRVEAVGVRCSVTPQRPGDVLSDTRTFYDDPVTFGAAPTRGLPVTGQEVGSWNGTTPVWVTTARNTYDVHGRVRDAFDALDRRTRTTYTPATGGPVTQRAETNPAGHTEIHTIEPAWALPTTVIDANGHRADLSYDGAGRLTAVWLPGRDKQTQSASQLFSYLLRNDAPTAVTTRRLLPDGASYLTSITLYDGMLRERQAQTQTHGGGRVVTDTHYNARGLVEWRADEFYDTSNAPSSTTLVGAGDVPTIPGVVELTYDGAERVITEVFLNRGAEAWRTSYAYGGDRTHTTPPPGGTATTVITDARGRQTALRQYHGPTATGTYDETAYTYTGRDELETVTDPVGNVWSYTYDQRGRRTGVADPDQGLTATTYDAAGQRLTVTDARGVTLGYTYDQLGRNTSIRDGSPTGPKRAEWVFDTLPNGAGKLTRSIRHHDGEQYVTEVRGYNARGLPTGHTVTVPAAETGLAGTYETLIGYKPDGSVETTTLPAAGDLAAEELVVGYDDVGAATWLVSALAVYVGTVLYSTLGDLTQRRLGEFGKRVTLSYSYDDATRRLMASRANVETGSGLVEVRDLGYTYDSAGNLTRVADSPGGATPSDTQCFRYDYLRRLTDAWTPQTTDSKNCDAGPGALGGAAPYRFAWTFDQTGNRLTQRRFGLGGGLTTYSHPQPGSPHPHAVTQASTTSATGTQVNTYGYDDAGNLIERVRQGEAQSLSWNAEGKIGSVEDAGGVTEFVYDADGNRLIRRDPAGKTLYLNGTELRYDSATGWQRSTRYYAHLGSTVAVRTATGLTWLVNDRHGTGEVAVRASDRQVQQRRTTPFGELRGQPPAWWPGDKGFVGGTEDPTGFTHLGARLYDQTLGRFISVDPVIDVTQPQQMHGYAYANNSPPSFLDADGLFFKEIGKAIGNKVGNAVLNAGKAVVGAVGNAVDKVVTHSGTISTVLGIASMACMVLPPPAQAVGAGLSMASFAFGAIDTANQCVRGSAIDCAAGAASLIPGVKGVRGALDLLHARRAARQATRDLVEVRTATRAIIDHAMRGYQRTGNESYWNRAIQAHRLETAQVYDYFDAWRAAFAAERQMWKSPGARLAQTAVVANAVSIFGQATTGHCTWDGGCAWRQDSTTGNVSKWKGGSGNYTPPAPATPTTGAGGGSSRSHFL
jgi:RHS repeat-associated protein